MKAETDLFAAMSAVVDMRALVEECVKCSLTCAHLVLHGSTRQCTDKTLADRFDCLRLSLSLHMHVHASACVRCSQVTEKEKWQRYCWELETRLHDALHASKAQEVRARNDTRTLLLCGCYTTHDAHSLVSKRTDRRTDCRGDCFFVLDICASATCGRRAMRSERKRAKACCSTWTRTEASATLTRRHQHQ